VAATTAAVVSYAPVLAVVVLLRLSEGAGPGLAAPARLATAGWLLAHGVPVQAGTGVIGVAPLAVSALAAWRLARAGVHVTRAIGARRSGSVRKALVAAAATGVAYGALGLLVAAATAGPGGWWADPVRAGATLAGGGFLAASYGSFRTTGASAAVAARLPTVLRVGWRAGVVAGLLVLAAGAAAVGIAVAVGGGAAADTIAAYRTGVAGQAGLTLVCLAYSPNLAVWAAAYLLGPGFAVGADTVVRSSEVTLGPLPALPVFAGLPDGPLPSVGAALLLVPTVAGFAAGWWPARRPRDGRARWPARVAAALVAGPVAGALLAAAAAASGGPLGAGHLATTGPVPWLVGAFGAALVTPGTVLATVVAGVTAPRGTGPRGAGPASPRPGPVPPRPAPTGGRSGPAAGG